MAVEDRGMEDGVRTGDVLQMTHWHHIFLDANGRQFQANFKVPRRGMAALFLYIGARDVRAVSMEKVDLKAEMGKLGWYRVETDIAAAAIDQRDLLAAALLKLVTALGTTPPPQTGPELLRAAATAAEEMQQHKEAFDGLNG